MNPADFPGIAAWSPLLFEADSLDYSGWILVNGRMAGKFEGPHKPVRMDLSTQLPDPRDPFILTIVFDTPPEVHGQVGYTSRTRELKPRYNYSWDWCPRLVPIGAFGGLRLRLGTDCALQPHGLRASLSADHQVGNIVFSIDFGPLCDPSAGIRARMRLIAPDGSDIQESDQVLHLGTNSLSWSVMNPALWNPLGMGPQALYTAEIEVLEENGNLLRRICRRFGFKSVEWLPNPGAPADARPWLCAVNGREVFLQGVNWTPVRLAYPDTTDKEYEKLVGLYARMGCNLLRVWGGGFLETTAFYDACDRSGILVWQEFPLSSSGIDNRPPHDPQVITELCTVARHFIRTRQHHASLLLWCGGNELQTALEGEARETNRPCDETDPCLAALAAITTAEDPGRRFVPTSPSGPVFAARREDFGKGLHHHVHGPWGFGDFEGMDDWKAYWDQDDSTFRSEVGMPSANDSALFAAFGEGLPTWPPETPYWKHSAGWWTQKHRLFPRFAHLPDGEALDAYIEHSRNEQAEALAYAARACKARFPACSGFLVWMGHDCFPCPANTSIIDFLHQPKPAYHALRSVFRDG